MANRSGDSSRSRRSTSSEHDRPFLARITRTSDNWRGKNDPGERRRIQNRLNQRAYRQRQRAGESSANRVRATSGPELQRERAPVSEHSQDETDPNHGTSYSEPTPPLIGHTGNRAASAPSLSLPNTSADITRPRVWDELAQMINRNFMAAATSNAQVLELDLDALRSSTPVCTPRPQNTAMPASLTPLEIQHQTPHDPIIDVIPHRELRSNILQAMASGTLNVPDFLASIRASGTLEEVNGSWQRVGFVVWDCAEEMASWELSEAFCQRFAKLLRDCDDLIAVTNDWRTRRGEPPVAFVSDLGALS